MKENLKIALLAVIALCSVTQVYLLSDLGANNSDSAMEEGNSIVATNVNQNNSNVISNPTAANPTLPEGVTYTDNKIVPPPVDMKKTTVNWGNMIHDFGRIKQNSTNKYSFQFTNTGNEPLLITNAVGSCGCTVPSYPKEPILPGKTATIDVEYKPGMQELQQEKTVTVTANTEPYETKLKIRAFVEKENK